MGGTSVLLKSSLAKKYWMALTGLFLSAFLVIHLIGNLQLFPFMGGQENFNAYAHFMTTFPLIKATSYLLYGSIFFHAFDGLLLVYQNKRARPVAYAYNKPQANSMWASRNMGLLGTIILVFIVTHMANFWFRMHWGPIGTDPAGNKDLWTVVYAFFQSPGTGLWFTLFYVLGMAALGFHLFHGFQSAFHSLGVRHERYTPVIKFLGYGLSIVFPLLFAAIPVFIYATGINS